MGLPNLTRSKHGNRTNRHVLAPRRARSFLLRFTTLFAVMSVVICLVAGSVLTSYITSGDSISATNVRTSVFVAFGASLGALFCALFLLVVRASSIIRRNEHEADQRVSVVKSSYEAIVAIMAAALDLQDNVTQNHSRRVAELASTLARQIGLRKEQVRQIQKAAILHDIGKIGVADAVLSKAGPLSDTEWEEMKRHPELGFEIVKDIEFLRDAAGVVHTHHERWDGTGYPRGLRGEQIPIGARIFAVVDAYEAMTSQRPYRKALPHETAIAEVLRNSGTQFDPEVVRAFREAESRGLVEGANGHNGGTPELPTMYRHPEELPIVNPHPEPPSDPRQGSQPEEASLSTGDGS